MRGARGELLLAGKLAELADQGADLGDGLLGHLDGAEHLLLGGFLGVTFDHRDAQGGAGDDDLELCLVDLVIGRVDQVLAVDEGRRGTAAMGPSKGMSEIWTAALAAMTPRMSGGLTRSVEMQVGTTWISRPKALSKRGRMGRSDDARHEDLAVLGARLALDEAAGDLARGVSTSRCTRR